MFSGLRLVGIRLRFAGPSDDRLKVKKMSKTFEPAEPETVLSIES